MVKNIPSAHDETATSQRSAMNKFACTHCFSFGTLLGRRLRKQGIVLTQSRSKGERRNR